MKVPLQNNQSDLELLPIKILKQRSSKIIPLCKEILALKDSNKLEPDYLHLIASFLHMMLNRIFKARQRTFELVVYDMLYRHYKSLAGREKSQNKKTIFAQD